MPDTPAQHFADGRILAATDCPLGRITINNPERRNAMSLAMWDGLRSALQLFAGNDEIRAVVLSGAGREAFVSGADISEFDAMRSTPEGVRDYTARYEGADDALYQFSKPTIAQISGFCVGGGMALALSCDLRLASGDLRMGIPAAKLGLGYGYTGVQRLTGIAGPAVAAEVLFSGRLFDAQEALQAGLVNRIVPGGQDALSEAVTALATGIARNAPLTVEAAKAAIRAATGPDPEGARAVMEARAAACSASEDYTEGCSAFVEKRTPVFRRR